MQSCETVPSVAAIRAGLHETAGATAGWLAAARVPPRQRGCRSARVETPELGIGWVPERDRVDPHPDRPGSAPSLFVRLYERCRMLAPADVGDLEAIRAETRATIREAVSAEERTLVEAPPQALDPAVIFDWLDEVDAPVTYLAPRRTYYDRVSDWVETNTDLTVRTAPSPFHECPTFTNDNKGNHEAARRMYRRGFSAPNIHRLHDVVSPCYDPGLDGPSCPYLLKRKDFVNKLDRGDLDLLIGNHRHARNADVVTDRIVLLDRCNPEAFVHEFPAEATGPADTDLEEIIRSFLARLRTWTDRFPADTFGTARDIVDNREAAEPLDQALDWFDERDMDLDAYRGIREYQPYRLQDASAHRFAHLLTFALLTMRPIDAEFEIAPPPDHDRINQVWEDSWMHPNARAVRNRDSGHLQLLLPPDLEPARQVVGLDVLPSTRLWDRVFGGPAGFDHTPVVPREAIPDYLTDGIDLTVRRVGRGRYPYAGGRISDLDQFRFAAIRALEERPFALVTTGRALERYHDRNWIAPFVKAAADADHPHWDDHDYRAKSFGGIRWSRALEDEPLGVIAGSPYPGHEWLRTWAGFFGEPVEGIDSDGPPDGNGVAAELYDHFVRHRLLRTILQFGDADHADTDGTTIYLLTDDVPAWLDSGPAITVERDGKATAVLEYLIEVADADDALALQNAASVTEQLDVDRSYVRELFDRLDAAGLVADREGGRHGTTLYRWAGDAALHPVGALPDYTHALPVRDRVYLLDL